MLVSDDGGSEGRCRADADNQRLTSLGIGTEASSGDRVQMLNSSCGKPHRTQNHRPVDSLYRHRSGCSPARLDDAARLRSLRHGTPDHSPRRLRRGLLRVSMRGNGGQRAALRLQRVRSGGTGGGSAAHRHGDGILRGDMPALRPRQPDRRVFPAVSVRVPALRRWRYLLVSQKRLAVAMKMNHSFDVVSVLDQGEVTSDSHVTMLWRRRYAYPSA